MTWQIALALVVGFATGLIGPGLFMFVERRRVKQDELEFKRAALRTPSKNVTRDAALEIDRPRGRQSRAHLTARRHRKV